MSEIDEKNFEKATEQYGDSQIQVLEGLEAVRKRPGMYIGTTSVKGLHHLIYEIVDNSIDEALAGFCDEICVTLCSDGSVLVEDDGRGVPAGINEKLKLPTLEVIFATLHAGGKFGGGGYAIAGGLHGVGASVVNALSEKLIATNHRDGKVYRISFSKGKTVEPFACVGETDRHGLTVQFWPDGTIFETTEFDTEIVRARLREQAFLNAGVKLVLKDEREPGEFAKKLHDTAFKDADPVNVGKVVVQRGGETADADTPDGDARKERDGARRGRIEMFAGF